MLTTQRNPFAVTERTVHPLDVTRGAPAMLEAIALQTKAAADTVRAAQRVQAQEVRTTYDEWVGVGGESYRWRMALERKPPEKLTTLLDRYANACEAFAGTLRRSEAQMEAALGAFAGIGLSDPIPAVTLHRQGLTRGPVDIDESRINAHLAANPRTPVESARELVAAVRMVCEGIENLRDEFARALSEIDTDLRRYPTRRTKLGPSATDETAETLLRRYGDGDGTDTLVAEPGSPLSEYVKERQPVLRALNDEVANYGRTAAADGTKELTRITRIDVPPDAPLSEHLLFRGEESMIRVNATTTTTNLPDGTRQVTIDGTYTLQNIVDPQDTSSFMGLSPDESDLPGRPYPVRVTWTGSTTLVYDPNGRLISQEGYP